MTKTPSDMIAAAKEAHVAEEENDVTLHERVREKTFAALGLSAGVTAVATNTNVAQAAVAGSAQTGTGILTTLGVSPWLFGGIVSISVGLGATALFWGSGSEETPPSTYQQTNVVNTDREEREDIEANDVADMLEDIGTDAVTIAGSDIVTERDTEAVVATVNEPEADSEAVAESEADAESVADSATDTNTVAVSVADASPDTVTDADAVVARGTDPLLAELALIDQSRRATALGDDDRAQDILEEHARRFPSGQTATEREAERIAQACRRGQPGAQTQANRFLRTYGQHPSAPLIRRVCHEE